MARTHVFLVDQKLKKAKKLIILNKIFEKKWKLKILIKMRWVF